jgi:hypothetical protein
MRSSSLEFQSASSSSPSSLPSTASRFVSSSCFGSMATSNYWNNLYSASPVSFPPLLQIEVIPLLIFKHISKRPRDSQFTPNANYQSERLCWWDRSLFQLWISLPCGQSFMHFARITFYTFAFLILTILILELDVVFDDCDLQRNARNDRRKCSLGRALNVSGISVTEVAESSYGLFNVADQSFPLLIIIVHHCILS